MVPKKMAKKNWGSVLIGGERNPEAIIKLCNFRWLRGRLRQCFSDTVSKRKQAARDALPGMLEHDALFSHRSVVSKRALLKKEDKAKQQGSIAKKDE